MLAHPVQMPATPYWYMGVLSRWENKMQEQIDLIKNEIEFLAIVSGPEPQRTLFEQQIWEQGNAIGKKFLMVAGLPNQSSYHKISPHGECYHHLDSEALAKQIKSAKYIVCRGGYTSLMELNSFQKKLILVPTPGQTEQEYLAAHWSKQHWAVGMDAAAFDLRTAMDMANKQLGEYPAYTGFSAEALATSLKTLNL